MIYSDSSDIWIIEKMISPPICDMIKEIYDSINDPCKSTTYVSQGKVIDALKVPEAQMAHSLFTAAIKKPVQNLLRFYDYPKLVQGQTLIARYDEGEGCAAHNDIVLKKGQNIASHSVLAFLNDDYEGGEFCFPRKSLSFKPDAGTIMLFPVSFTHTHAVEKVKKGSRYSMFSLLNFPVYESHGIEFTI